MNLEKLKEKPIFQMTGEEFIFLQRNMKPQGSIVEKNDMKKVNKNYVYGIKGIEEICNCSNSTAKRIKKSGVIADAIIQYGRKIIIDSEKARKLLKEAEEAKKAV